MSRTIRKSERLSSLLQHRLDEMKKQSQGLARSRQKRDAAFAFLEQFLPGRVLSPAEYREEMSKLVLDAECPDDTGEGC